MTRELLLRAENLRTVLHGAGEPVRAVPLTRNRPAVVIAGSRDPGHARDNATAGDVELDEQTLVEIEGVLTD